MPYRYDWIWQKTLPVGFLNANRMPLRAHEHIYVFYKRLPMYNPQMRTGFKPYKGSKTHHRSVNYRASQIISNDSKGGMRYPIDVIKIANGNGKAKHPTQKPVELLEYLIKTYTTEGMAVLDNTMGSGSTGVAAVNLKRNFIGMELDDSYFEIAKERIEKADRSTFAG